MSNKGDFAHIFQINELESVSYKLFEFIEKLKVMDMENFENEYGFSSEYTFPNVIWSIQTIFSSTRIDFQSKHAYFLSNEMFLNVDDENFDQCMSKYEDLQKSGTTCVFIPIGNKDHFKSNEFYAMSDLLGIVGFSGLNDAIESFADCNLCAQSLSKQGRVVSKIPLFFDKVDAGLYGNDLESALSVKVNLHNLTQSTSINKKCLLEQKTNKEVKTFTYLTDSNERPIVPTEYSYRLISGHPKVKFDADEYQKLKILSYPTQFQKLGSGFLKINGFVDTRDTVIDFLAIRKSYFVSCSDINSARDLCLFKSLAKSCHRQKKCIAVTYCPNFKSKLFNGVMTPHVPDEIPQNPTDPPIGFYLRNLPFKGEFRSQVLEETADLTSSALPNEQIKRKLYELAAINTVEKDFAGISNNIIRKTQAIIEAVALDREEAAEIVDEAVIPPAKKSKSQKILQEISAIL